MIKSAAFIFMVLSILSSCIQTERNTVQPQNIIADSLHHFTIKDEINYTDKNGLKQGFWIIKDTFQQQISEGYYKDNLIDSIFKRYQLLPKPSLVSMSFYENGNILWSLMPEYFNQTHPRFTKAFALKGIIIYEDSVYVKVPYENGSIWFEGAYVRTFRYQTGLPFGVLKSYHRNGKLHTIENWTIPLNPGGSYKTGGASILNGRFQSYDSIGNKLLDTNFHSAPWML